jgi:hypothetical protein
LAVNEILRENCIDRRHAESRLWIALALVFLRFILSSVAVFLGSDLILSFLPGGASSGIAIILTLFWCGAHIPEGQLKHTPHETTNQPTV